MSEGCGGVVCVCVCVCAWVTIGGVVAADKHDGVMGLCVGDV